MSLLVCNHCHTTKECKLDPETMDVVCMECREIVEGVSPFFKNSMKSQGDFLRKKKESFSFKCPKCKKNMKGVLSKNASHVVCEKCETQMDVSPHMIQALRTVQSNTKGNADINDFSKQIVDKVDNINKVQQAKKTKKTQKK